MANKMTRTMALSMAIEVVANEDAKVVLQKMLTSLENKKSTPRKPSAKTLENAELRKVLLEYLATKDEPVNISTIKAEVKELNDATSSRVSALMTPLVKDDVVTKEYLKKVVHYSLAE